MGSKIYTRKGDLGETKLFSGEKVAKDDLRLETYGTFDELQAQLGMARALIRDDSIACIVYEIQQDISAACAELASNPEVRAKLKRHITKDDVTKLEKWIDSFTATYGLPSGFIIPGRSPESAAMHVSRTVCRRGERSLVKLNRQGGGYEDLLVYFNRLSDLCFTLGWSLEVRHVV